MIDYDLKPLIENYRKRVEFAIKLNNLNVRSRTYDSQVKKYIKNRAKQLGTFLEDGKILFNLEGEEDLTISNPKLGNGCFQYYNLEDSQLIAYIGFRSKLRKNIVPKNPQMSFLAIYLMEILNDFYSTSFEAKLNLVKKTEKLFPKGVKYKNLITEAFENLFFLCPINLSISEFKKKYETYTIFEKFSEDPSIFNKYEYIYDKSRRGLELSRIDDFLIKNSFKKVIEELIEKDFNLNLNGYTISIDESLKKGYEKYKTSINKLYCLYPINVEKELFDKVGRTLIVSNGTLKNYGPPNYPIEFFNRIIEFSKNSFRKLLDGPKIVKEESQSFINSYFLRNKFLQVDKEREVFEIIKKWIDENPYCKNAYKLSLSQLEFNKKQSEFDIDLTEVTKIRESSAKIQDKLIIEEVGEEKTDDVISLKLNNQSVSYFESLRNNKKVTSAIKEDKSGEIGSKSSINEPLSGKLKENSDNIYISVVNSLTATELQVLKSLLSGKIERAKEIAQKENVMLSLIIDEINSKASELTEDIIIEEEMVVEDYKQQLIKALS